ncbi:hypothetical protein BCR33DRAFT_721127 [Rhizoclosmatium globosum]|uniref:Uncharacterized protein n=1 Tax=Rhizoclosmatium globosum TaxID=329046 RepID=A0A1Y2BT58_9FUNG|nr:hypothetical protein BCR33DRAFT_721127 [Rhizoclosmatium globosum]|eukprot:ORY37923.1 hypothetical protein BCR33DRAFT_721127 [Rhizoclosmatium globosum]
MNTNDIDKNGDIRPLTDIFCNTTIEQRTQFNVPPMLQFAKRVWDLVAGLQLFKIEVTILFLLFNDSELTFYYDGLDRAAVEVQSGEHFVFQQFGYQVFY